MNLEGLNLRDIVNKVAVHGRDWLIIRLNYVKEYYWIITCNRRHTKALAILQGKKKIKVAFFVIHKTVWKCDDLYKMLESSERFEPFIVICPYVTYGRDIMLKEMDDAIEFFKLKKFAVIQTYNSESNVWLDVKKEIDPDIVFFTNPHKLTRPEYYITNYMDKLTCYVPYGFMIANIQDSQYNQLFHNLIWKSFYETTIHKGMAQRYARNRGRNVVVTGYPACDVFIDREYKPRDVWKSTNKRLKRIIWAPHHTIEKDDKQLGYSTFLQYHQFFLDLAEKYKDKIQLAFKPHPILKNKLYLHPDWGNEKTDVYYSHWNTLLNGQLEVGVYEDLFLTSDALILDSISFIAEYLYTSKPSLFVFSDSNPQHEFNEFGRLAINQLYLAYMDKDILNFIEKIVLSEKDSMRDQRTTFLNEYLRPVNNISATRHIYNFIETETHP